MPESAGIQFDRAEFDKAAAGGECAQCHQSLAGFYYDVNGQTVCEACRYAVEAAFNAGSGVGRFVRAFGLGLVAAVIGFGIYYGIAALTGYEFGLIAIVVGFLVGFAVRIGSRGRGGWLYQTLAVVLTYLAIVSTYIPPIIQGFREAAKKEAAQVEQTTGAPDPARAPHASPAARAQASTDTTANPPAPRAAAVVIAVALLLALACAAPFLAGFQNVIGLVIIGIGIYQAWKINRRVEIVITGPHAIAAAKAPAV